MRIAIIGRTASLIEAARQCIKRGHEVPLIYTCRAPDFYDTQEADFQALASELGAIFYCDLNINERRQHIQSLGCDIALSVNWAGLLSDDTISAFTHGILNAHAGDLPKYRGNACPNWAILNGEETVGLTIHKMTNDLDSGPIVLKTKMSLSEDTYISDIYDWLSENVPTYLVDAAEGLVGGRLSEKPQSNDPTNSLRCFPRRPEDSRIRWDTSAQQISRLVRASSHPFSGAFTFLEDERKVFVWRAKPYSFEGEFLAIPGQVCLSNNGNPVIACRQGMLEIIDVHIEGSEATYAKAEILSSLRNRLT